MSDKRLRELERRWMESGLVEDEVPYLQEKVDQGQLRERMLKLAANCGHLASRRLVSPTPRHVINEKDWTNSRFLLAGMASWLRGFDREVSVRAATAVAVKVLPIWGIEFPHVQSPYLALIACRGWITSQCAMDATKVQRADDSLNPLTVPKWARDSHSFERSMSYEAALDCISMACRTIYKRKESSSSFMRNAHNSAVTCGMETDKIVHQVWSTLIPWALGYGDPLLEELNML